MDYEITWEVVQQQIAPPREIDNFQELICQDGVRKKQKCKQTITTRNKSELLIKTHTGEIQDQPRDLTGTFYQTDKEELNLLFSTTPENRTGRNTFKFIPRRQYHPDTETKDATPQK